MEFSYVVCYLNSMQHPLLVYHYSLPHYIFIQPIRRTFNKNTHSYESNAIEIDERENIKYIFIYIFFSLEISQRNENWFLTESYTSLGATIAPSLSFIVVSTDINSAMDNLARTSQQFLAIGNTAGTVLTAGIIS